MQGSCHTINTNVFLPLLIYNGWSITCSNVDHMRGKRLMKNITIIQSMYFITGEEKATKRYRWAGRWWGHRGPRENESLGLFLSFLFRITACSCWCFIRSSRSLACRSSRTLRCSSTNFNCSSAWSKHKLLDFHRGGDIYSRLDIF